MPFVTANDGTRLFYEARGSGPPIVLVHGWSGSHRYFDNCIEHLHSKLSGHQIVAVDLRFHGDSDKPSWGFHVSRLAADLRDVIGALKLEHILLLLEDRSSDARRDRRGHGVRALHNLHKARNRSSNARRDRRSHA